MGRSNVGDGFVMPYFAAYETGFVPFGQPLVLPCVVIVPLLINVVNALACDIKLILNSYSYSSKLFRIDEINCKKKELIVISLVGLSWFTSFIFISTL